MSDSISQKTSFNNNTQTTKKKILVAEAGISGLSAAFELSEDPSLDITIVESSATCGGKMIGYANVDQQRFEEHSIRTLNSTYFSSFSIFNRGHRSTDD